MIYTDSDTCSLLAVVVCGSALRDTSLALLLIEILYALV